jgi:hypothetical protein
MKVLLASLIVFDLALGLGSILAPSLIEALAWPTASVDAGVLLRRTGAIWLFFALAELAAFSKPTGERLRLVAVLRWMDVLADTLWLAFGSGFTTLGLLAIGAAPVCNLGFGILLWRYAARRDSESTAPANIG